LGISFEKEEYVIYAIAPNYYILKGSKYSDKKDVRKTKECGLTIALVG
jgi:hypothetical protein